MAKKRAPASKKTSIAYNSSEHPTDLIEVQYWIAELRSAIEAAEEMEVPVLKKEQGLQNQLAEVQELLGELRLRKRNAEDALKEMLELEPLFLSEVDATATLKAALRQGKVDVRLNLYFTESKIEYQQMQKALNTVGADYYANEKGDADHFGYTGMYVIEIDDIPDSYREFLYGVEQETDRA